MWPLKRSKNIKLLESLPKPEKLSEEDGNWLTNFQVEFENLKDTYEFPDCLNFEDCQRSVEYFVNSRRPYTTKNEDINFVWGRWSTRYPLPIGAIAIVEWMYLDGIDFNKAELELMPPAIVEKRDAILACAMMVESEKAKCWVLGLVKPDVPLASQTKEDLEKMTAAEYWHARYAPGYHFTESMLLYEGEPDVELFGKATSVKKEFDAKVLGKSMRGRPPEDIKIFVSLAKSAFRGNPRLTQERLAEVLGCDVTTVKRKVHKAGFRSFPELRRALAV